jgi:hypothetical protein
MYYVSRAAGVAALISMGIAIWFSIVLARADSYFRQGNPEAVARAVGIAPRNTEYLALRALQVDYDGGDAAAIYQEMAKLNPLSSAPRIRVGLAAELRGDAPSAERWLLDAAAVDHQFEPRWTLANFYFRQDNREEFWKWMRAALEASYGDRTPAFDLCWRVSGDAGEIFRRAIPDAHEVTAAYLGYLAQTNRLAGTWEVARRLAAFHDASDLPLFYGVCDQLLAARNPDAREVWALIDHRETSGHGFDWRWLAAQGVSHSDWRVTLNGSQPESCSLLQKTLDAAAGKRYRLSWEARTTGIRAPSGIMWRVEGQQAEVAPGDDWHAGQLTFSATEIFPALELVYQRPAGEPRAEGAIELRNVRVEAVP